jgi:hypothetical protein
VWLDSNGLSGKQQVIWTEKPCHLCLLLGHCRGVW